MPFISLYWKKPHLNIFNGLICRVKNVSAEREREKNHFFRDRRIQFLLCKTFKKYFSVWKRLTILSLDVNYFSTINLINLDIILIFFPQHEMCTAITVLFCFYSQLLNIWCPLFSPHIQYMTMQTYRLLLLLLLFMFHWMSEWTDSVEWRFSLAPKSTSTHTRH